jgi:DNA invertase Pin-like site-specific DNA recombinase
LPETDSLLAFLGHVRRRFYFTEAIRHGIFASVLGLSGLILLLLAGTQIFDWYWPTLLLIIGLGAGIWRFRRNMPDTYRLAQITDRRLLLADSLSTAYFFRAKDGDLEKMQRAEAAKIAATLSPRQAVPMVWPKSTYAMAALSLTAFTLIGVRYGILNTLDLSAPVSEAFVDVFRFTASAEKKKIAQKQRDEMDEELKKLGLSIDENAKDELRKIEMAKEGEITTSDIPDVNDLSDTARGEKGKASTEGKGTNPGEAGEEGEGTKEAQNADPNGSPKEGTPEGPRQKDAEGNGKQGGKGGDQQNQNSNMLDKMKDAFANMMNKLKLQNQNDGQQQASSKGGEKGGQQKGGQQPGKQQGAGKDAQNGAEQPGDASEASEKQANAQGQSGDKSASMQTPPDAKSGVGKADGDKSVKEAEQLQAMGKISEILGKRAKDISGEVMVEVNGGKQQLRTQYTNSNARHAENSGEVNRDEVPLHHQHYVQQYFEEVRKQSAPAKK